MIRPIVLWPDARLNVKSVEVNEITDEFLLKTHNQTVAQLIDDMFDTMFDARGIGLAAIQIGVPLRIFVMEAVGKDWVFINPKLLQLDGIREYKNEGCLSLPGVIEMMDRYPKVSVVAKNRAGEEFVEHFEGIEAQCIQHEYEHLDGVVIPDKLSSREREKLRKQMKKGKIA